MKEIDWSKAPEGATHFDTRGNCCSIGFMKPGVRRGEWEYFGMDGHWILYGPACSKLKAAMVARPEIHEWNGEGLPPAGTVCEFKAGHSQFPELSWTEVRINSHDSQGGRDFAVFASMSGYGGCSDPADFRPIRTPEQIAAEEREQAIQQLAEGLHVARGFRSPLEHTLIVAEWLHDNGYRKVTP